MSCPYQPTGNANSLVVVLFQWGGITLSTLSRHAKSREPGNLVPGHFWSKIRTFVKNQRFKEINLNSWCGFVKKQVQMDSSFIIFLPKHHNI